jgi:DNA polymerase-1
METAMRLYGKTNPKDVTSEMRSFAKRINFGVVYGITKHGLARQLNKTEEECEEMLERYWKDHPKIRKWMKKNVDEAYDTLEVRNRFGRVRHVPDIVSNVRWIRESAERTASNSKIQSLGADLTMWSMGSVDAVLLKKKTRSMVIGQIHDSLMLDVFPGEEEQVANIVRTTMVSVANKKFSFLNIPLKSKIETGYRWSDLKEYKKVA